MPKGGACAEGRAPGSHVWLEGSMGGRLMGGKVGQTAKEQTFQGLAALVRALESTPNKILHVSVLSRYSRSHQPAP